MEDFDYMIIIGIIYIINCIFLLLINIALCLIHIKEQLFHVNFFKVIFSQIILETLIPFFILILVLIILFTRENKTWYLFFHVIINICTITDLFYNIITLIYLTFNSNKKKNDNNDNQDIDLKKSIALEKYSFKFIHISSCCLGLVHSIIFFLIRDTNSYTINSFEDWFYFFCPIKASVPTIFIFIPFLVIFIISIPYKFVSQDTLKVTNYIHLNHFCINCMMFGLLGIIMPIIKVIAINVKYSGFPVLIFSSAFFLLYLNCICFFRINCMYIDNLLEDNDKGFSDKIKFFINLIFCRIKVPKSNYIDFNNNFIYHSLAYESDFNDFDPRNAKDSLNDQN